MTPEFPWRNITQKEVSDEYKRLCKILNCEKYSASCFNSIAEDQPLPFSTKGFPCSNKWFQYERMNTPGIGRPSTVEYWKKKHQNITAFSDREKRDLFSTCNFFNHAPSQFPIVTAGIIYKFLGATKILDPYAGWGDRCLASIALNIPYIGIDKNEALREPYNAMIREFSSECTQMIFSKAEDVHISSLDFDFVLTSPPWWVKGKMIERYEGIEISFDQFMTQSLIPVFRRLIVKAKYVCLYISESMYLELSKIFGKCNFVISFKTTSSKVSTLYCWSKQDRA